MSRRATLRIFEEELRVIASEIRRFPDRETGGALYGLWSHAGQPTVWLATRPGPRALRRRTYFADDVETHMAVEKALWQHFGMQCVGVWHSHHRLGMPVLSSGDIERTRTYARHTGRERFTEILGYYLEDGRVGLKPWLYPKAVDGSCVPTTMQALAGSSPLREQLRRAGLAGLGDALVPGSPTLPADWVLEDSEPGFHRPAEDDGWDHAPDTSSKVVAGVEALVADHIDASWLEHLELFTSERGYVILEVGPGPGAPRLRILFGWGDRLQVLRWEVVRGLPPATETVAAADPARRRRGDVPGLIAEGAQCLRENLARSDDGVEPTPAVPPGDGAKDPP